MKIQKARDSDKEIIKNYKNWKCLKMVNSVKTINSSVSVLDNMGFPFRKLMWLNNDAKNVKNWILKKIERTP